MRFASFLLIVCLSALCQTALSQETRRVQIQTSEDRTFIGHVQSESPQEIILLTESLGEVAIPKMNILSITDIAEGEVVSNEGKNAQPSRYFFAPSGFQLPKGEGYYQNTLLFYNQFSYGISDHVTVGVPIVIPFLGGISIKVGTQLGSANEEGHSLHSSAGVLYLVPITGNTSIGGGIAFSNLSYGNENNNITFGLGQTFANNGSDVQDLSESPLINLGGMLKVGRRKWLMSENYFSLGGPTTDAQSLLSLGIRAGRPNESGALWDIALLTDGNVIFPSVGVTVPFSRNNAGIPVTY